MNNNRKLRLLIIFTTGISLFLIILGVYVLSLNFYKKIFRLSYDEVTNSLTNDVFQCVKIIECKLLPGDILIRRYITQRTFLFNKLANPYFTHSAFYLGDDQIVQAVGKEKNRDDDIKIEKLSKSDWFNFDMNNFVIVRPKNYNNKLDIIKNNLINIAQDKDYIFGIPKKENKKLTCADLIFKQLFSENIVNIQNIPDMITPDYLFFMANNNQSDFEIVGYNVLK